MEIGDRAPEFELPDETGAVRSLQGLLAEGPLVLYFYPAAMTPGCTAESCHFRDLQAEFAAVGAQRVGISTDAVERQKQFSDKYSFDFPLLSDPEGEVARRYGVRRNLGLMPTKRVTFVIGTDGVVLDVIKSEIRFSKHADQALATLRSSGRDPGSRRQGRSATSWTTLTASTPARVKSSPRVRPRPAPVDGVAWA